MSLLWAQAARTFFHASTHRFEEGDEIRPGSEVGKRTFKHDMGGISNHRVCMAPTMDHAEEWAKTIAYRNDPVHIYEVSASGARKYSDSEHRAASATVMRHVKTVEGWD